MASRGSAAAAVVVVVRFRASAGGARGGWVVGQLSGYHSPTACMDSLGKCRRLTKDRERSVLSSEAFVKLAMIHLMLNRLEPKHADPDFHYRMAA